MKHYLLRLALPAITGLLLPSALWAETMTPYSADFNTNINTSDHSFKVASGWGHIPESYDASDGYYGTETYWVKYSYKSTDGVDGTPCLFADTQNIGYSYWGESDLREVNDLLVTPLLTGDVSLKVKAKNTSNSSITFFIVTDGNKFDKNDPVKTVKASELSTSSFTEVSIPIDAPARIGIRASNVYIDDLTATSAEVELVKGLSIAELSNDYYSYDFLEQPDGTVKYINPSTKEEGFGIKVLNSGDLPLTQGEANFSVCLADADGNPLNIFTEVPQSLAPGETSERFILSGTFNPDGFWKNSSSPTIYAKENITGSMKKIGTAYFRPYEAKFTFRLFDGYGTSSLSDTQGLGLITAGASKDYELYNDGIAPLEILSAVMTDGFTVAPAEAFSVESKGKKTFSVVAPATPGSYSSTLTITYRLKPTGEEMTYTLPFTATVLKEGLWTADFNGTNSTMEYPEGSVIESGITSANQYISSNNYDRWLKSYSSDTYATEKNKFITPLLEAEEGETMTFDAAYEKDGKEHFVKAYVSTDRVNWGEPLFEQTFTSDNTSLSTYSFTAPAAGQYYVGFALYGAKLDNIAGFKKAEAPAHDLFETGFSVESKKIDPNGRVYGGEAEYTFNVIPVVGQKKNDYALLFCMEDSEGNVETTEVDPVDLKQSASSAATIRVNHTTAYTKNTDVKAYLQFTFHSDNSVIKTPAHDLTISVEPDFLFIKKDMASTYRPDKNEAGPLSFGKVNGKVVNSEYAIANWGSAPLTVVSITVPDGFTAVAPEEPIPAKGRYAVEVTFDPQEAGTYSGDLTVTYLDAAGETQTYSIPVSGTMLDSSKWFGSFDDANHSTTGEWPAGTVYDEGLQLYNRGTYNQPNMGIITYNDDKWLSTPPLRAEAGEELQFSAMTNSSYRTPSIKVYAAATREGLKDESTRTELATINELPYNVMTDYTVTLPEGGTYYIGFQMGGYSVLDEIYGLSPVDYHELTVTASSLPQSQMQNVEGKAKVMLRNFGAAPETDYEVIVHVGEESYTVEAPAEIPMNHTLKASSSEPDTELAVMLRWPEIGTFPVSLEVKAGDYIVATEPADVTFTEELSVKEAVVGTPSTFSTDVPMKYNYRNSETIMLFTADEIGLEDGTPISGISFKGYTENGYTGKETVVKVLYELTDDTQLTQPSAGNLDLTGLNTISDGRVFWAGGGSKDDPAEMLGVSFAEPLVYEAGKSLRLVVCSYIPFDGSGYAPRVYFENTNASGNCYMASSDNQATADNDRGNITGSWSSMTRPVLRLNYALEPGIVNGKVTTADGLGAEGATVTLISDEGDNIRYKASADSEGNFTVKVVQTSRTYTAQAEKEGLFDKVSYVDPAEATELNFIIAPYVVLDDNASVDADVAAANLEIDLSREAGYNAVVLPVELTLSEIRAIYGESAEVFEFKGATVYDETIVWFQPSAAETFAAGTPLLIKSDEASAKLYVHGKDVVAAPAPVEIGDMTFGGQYAASVLEEGSFLLSAANCINPAGEPETEAYDEEADEADQTTVLRPFTAVVKSAKGIETLSFLTAEDVPTGVITIDGTDREPEIYNLQGIRVKNPTSGIYIINGKKVVIRR